MIREDNNWHNHIKRSNNNQLKRIKQANNSNNNNKRKNKRRENRKIKQISWCHIKIITIKYIRHKMYFLHKIKGIPLTKDKLWEMEIIITIEALVLMLIVTYSIATINHNQYKINSTIHSIQYFLTMSIILMTISRSLFSTNPYSFNHQLLCLSTSSNLKSSDCWKIISNVILSDH